MEKFATLEPVRLYASSAARAFSSHTNAPVQNATPPPAMVGRILASTPIGRLPAHIHAQIVRHLPLPDLPAYARVSRAANAVVEDEEFWAGKWGVLGIELESGLKDAAVDRKQKVKPMSPFEEVLELLEGREQEEQGRQRAGSTAVVEAEVDEFGDFAEADLGGQQMQLAGEDEMGDFVGGGNHGGGGFGGFNLFSSPVAPKSPPPPVVLISPTSGQHRPPPLTKKRLYKRAHRLLRPIAMTALAPSTPPHQVLSALAAYLIPTMFSPPPSALSPVQAQAAHPMATHAPDQPTLHTQSNLLGLLARFLSPYLQPVRNWAVLRSALRTAMDRFDASLLAAFDVADSRGDEQGMREAAEASWAVWGALEGGLGVSFGGGKGGAGGGGGDWEMGKVWAEKREIFYEQGRWDPLDNFT
jgi:recyclin-1